MLAEWYVMRVRRFTVRGAQYKGRTIIFLEGEGEAGMRNFPLQTVLLN